MSDPAWRTDSGCPQDTVLLVAPYTVAHSA